jgi:hypothetical protein
VWTGNGVIATNASDSYVAYGENLISGTEGDVQMPFPVGGTMHGLHVYLTTAPGVGASWTLTVDVNGTPSALTCIISGAVQTSCTDSSNVVISAGDLIDLDVTPTGSPALARLGWAATVTP